MRSGDLKGQGLSSLEGDPAHPFLFFCLEGGNLDPCLKLLVFIGDFYLRMAVLLCCVDVALKQGGDSPHGSGIEGCYRPPPGEFSTPRPTANSIARLIIE